MSVPSETPGTMDHVLDNLPKTYRKIWTILSPEQRLQACVAMFTDHGADKRGLQKDVLAEISKHRGWSNGMQFKEIARKLGPGEKGQAAFEVSESQRLSENFYSGVIKEWMLVHHIVDIGTRLDSAGVPNTRGIMNDFKGGIPVDALVSVMKSHLESPGTYSTAYLAYIFIESRDAKKGLWANADAALKRIKGVASLAPATKSPDQPLATPPEKSYPERFPRSQLSLYERALLRSLVEGAIDRRSELKSVEAEQMIRQLIDSSPGQPRHCFLLGFAQALHGRPIDMIEVGATAERDRWHLAGYLLGTARDVSDKEAYDRLMSPAPLLDRLLEADGGTHHELIECGGTLSRVLAASSDHGRLASLCRLLRSYSLGISNFLVADNALSLASRLASDEMYEAALSLIASARAAVAGTPIVESDSELLTRLVEVADYQKASVLLGMKDFRGAQEIYAGMIQNPRSEHRMGARVWMSLSKAGVNRIEEIFPHAAKERFGEIVRKLEAVSKEVQGGEASNHRLAQICNGLWLQHSGDHVRAIYAFDLAIAGMPGDSSYRRRKILQWTQLCRAISLVHDLMDSRLPDIKVAFQEAKEAGLKPSAWYMLEIAAPLGVFADPELIDLFGQLLPEGSLPDFNKAQWKLGAVKSDPRLQVTYLAWLESSNEPADTKWSQSLELLRSGWKHGGQAPEDALDFLSFLAFQDPKLAVRLIALLDELGPSDGMLSQLEITTVKARLHASCGDVTQAVALLKPLFFNIANSTDAYLQQMSLAIYEDIQELRGDVAPLSQLRQKLLAQFEPDEALNPDIVRNAGEIMLLYVGGNETQKRYEEDIRREFATNYPNVKIEYICPGWSSNWNKVVDVVRPKLAQADGLLLSYYVRTMFGRTIRRACPDNCPWWGADGHGKASIIRGLTKAAQQAALRRQRPKN